MRSESYSAGQWLSRRQWLSPSRAHRKPITANTSILSLLSMYSTRLPAVPSYWKISAVLWLKTVNAPIQGPALHVARLWYAHRTRPSNVCGVK